MQGISGLTLGNFWGKMKFFDSFYFYIFFKLAQEKRSFMMTSLYKPVVTLCCHCFLSPTVPLLTSSSPLPHPLLPICPNLSFLDTHILSPCFSTSLALTSSSDDPLSSSMTYTRVPLYSHTYISFPSWVPCLRAT